MTVEEALVGLLALVAGVLLFVGLAQALDSPGHSRRHWRRRGGAPIRRRYASERALRRQPGVELRQAASRESGEAPGEPPSEPAPPEAATPRRAAARPEQIPLQGLEPLQRTSQPQAASALTGAEPAEGVGPTEEASGEEPSAAPGSASPSSSLALLDECLRLYGEGRPAEALSAAEPGLRRQPHDVAGEMRSVEVAGLWTVVGLCRVALGDAGAARSALESGLGWTPEPGEGRVAGPLAEILATLGGELVREVDTGGEISEGAITELRLASALLRLASERVAAGEAAAELLERSREALWAGCEQRAGLLLARREFAEAHQVIEQALGFTELPDARRQGFRDLFWTSVTGEIGRLTGQALHGSDDGGDAMAKLERAEEVMRSLPPRALGPGRLEDLARRLWWGYTKLGIQRLESGDLAAALEPLYRALAVGELDAERRTETCQGVARALEAIAERSEAAVAALLRDGDHAAATAQGQELSRMIEEGIERGLSREELTGAMARRRHLMQRIEQGQGA